MIRKQRVHEREGTRILPCGAADRKDFWRFTTLKLPVVYLEAYAQCESIDGDEHMRSLRYRLMCW